VSLQPSSFISQLYLLEESRAVCLLRVALAACVLLVPALLAVRSPWFRACGFVLPPVPSYSLPCLSRPPSPAECLPGPHRLGKQVPLLSAAAFCPGPLLLEGCTAGGGALLRFPPRQHGAQRLQLLGVPSRLPRAGGQAGQPAGQLLQPGRGLLLALRERAVLHLH
jgi:hypothetical protein